MITIRTSRVSMRVVMLCAQVVEANVLMVIRAAVAAMVTTVAVHYLTQGVVQTANTAAHLVTTVEMESARADLVLQSQRYRWNMLSVNRDDGDKYLNCMKQLSPLHTHNHH